MFAAGSWELRNVLRLLRLLFRYGHSKEVVTAFQHGFTSGSVDTWLQVIPQVIARMDTPAKAVRRLIHDLLVAVGREHPQALVYPLTVAASQEESVAGGDKDREKYAPATSASFSISACHLACTPFVLFSLSFLFPFLSPLFLLPHHRAGAKGPRSSSWTKCAATPPS